MNRGCEEASERERERERQRCRETESRKRVKERTPVEQESHRVQQSARSMHRDVKQQAKVFLFR
jgi:hypothetical protein